LRAERCACRPGRTRDADDVADLLLVARVPRLDRDRPEHLGTGRQLEGREGGLEVVRLARDRGDPGSGRKVRGDAFVDLAAGQPGGVPADQRLQAGVGRLPHGEHGPSCRG
jgi:hypothetical protein